MINQQNLHCSSCGVKLNQGARFCSSCGVRIGTAMATHPEPEQQQQKRSLTNLQRNIEVEAVRKTAMSDADVEKSWSIYTTWLISTWVISLLSLCMVGSIGPDKAGILGAQSLWTLLMLITLSVGSIFTSAMKRNHKNKIQDFINNSKLIVEWVSEHTVKVRVEGTQEAGRPWKSIR